MKTYQFNMTLSANDNVSEDDILDKLVEFAEANGFTLGGGINLIEEPSDTDRFVSGCCEGEKCSVCGKDATNKLEESIFFDDPNRGRHPLTAYVCREHFRMIVGNLG